MQILMSMEYAVDESCRGNLPRLPRGAGYSEKLLDMMVSSNNTWMGNHTSKQPHLYKPTNLKRINRCNEACRHSSTILLSVSGRDFATRPPCPTTREGDLGLHMPGAPR
jgi:hypothetical protein